MQVGVHPSSRERDHVDGATQARHRACLARRDPPTKRDDETFHQYRQPQRGTMTSILAHVTFTGTGSKDSRLYPLWDQTRVWDPGRISHPQPGRRLRAPPNKPTAASVFGFREDGVWRVWGV